MLMDLVKRFSKNGTGEATGPITELQVVIGQGESREWLFRVDGEERQFRYEPSPLSPPRRVGEHVKVAYRSNPANPECLEAEYIAAA